MSFADSYLGQLRALVGPRLLRVPGTRIVIENAHACILLQKRSDFGNWGLPGGSGEIGESVEQTIRREVAEETGLVVNTLVPFGYATVPAYEVITFPNGHVCHFHSLLFACSDYEGKLHSDDPETTDLSWFDPEALPPMLPNMKRTVEAYRRYKETLSFQLL